MSNPTHDALETGVAKVFMHGRSQAVRLPKAFRFTTDRVRVRRHGRGILLEPEVADVDEWFGLLDTQSDVPFMPEGRDQPSMPSADALWS